MASVIGWLGKKAKAIEAQINPFDGGQTYNTVVNNTPPAAPPQQQPGQPPRPTGLNRIPGAGIVKSIATPFLDTAKFAAVDAPKMEIKKTFAGLTGNKVAAQNAQDQYTQSFRKTIPGGVYNNAERAANFGVALAQDPLIQRDINAGKYSPEAGNQLRDQNFAKAGFGPGYQNLSAGQAAKKIAPIVAAPIRDALTLGSAPEAKGITGVAKVGAINAVGSLPESLSQDNASLKSVAKDAATSFGVGAVLATPGAIGGRELPQTQRTAAPVKVPTLRPNEARTLSDLQDVYTGNIKNVKTQAAVLKDARAIQNRTGLDVTTGTPADIQTRINTALDQPQNSKRFFTPLNDVGAVGKDVRPSEGFIAKETKSGGQQMKIGLNKDKTALESNVVQVPPRNLRENIDTMYQKQDNLASNFNQSGERSQPPVLEPRSLSNKVDNADFMDKTNRYLGSKEAAKTQNISTVRALPKLKEADSVALMDAIESGNRDGNFGNAPDAVRGILENKYKQLTDAGIDIGHLQDYFPHQWKDPAKVAQEYQALNLRSGIQNPREFPTIAEGRKLGFEVRNKDYRQAINEYLNTADKLIANKQYFNDLQKSGLIAESGSRPQGMQVIDAPGLPEPRPFVDPETGAQIQGNYYARPDVARQLNKLFGEQHANKVLAAGAKASGFIQQIFLSGGVPGTGINAFGVAQTTKQALSGHPISAVRGMYHSFSKDVQLKYETKNRPYIEAMQREGIAYHGSLDTSALSSFGDKIAESSGFRGKTKTAIVEGWNKAIEDPTFKRLLPTYQLDTFKQAYNAAIKRNVSPVEASRIAGEATRSAFGSNSLATDALKSKNASNALSIIAFAPKYRESMLNFWGNNIKSLGHPASPKYRENVKFLAGATVLFGAMQAANAALNDGKTTFQNDNPNDRLSLNIPTGEGKSVSLPFLSSIATLPRTGVNIAADLATGKPKDAGMEAKKLLSMGVRPFVDLGTNQKYNGRKIYNETDPTAQKLKDQGTYLAGQFNHPWVRAGIDSATGKSSGALETLATATELPLRFRQAQDGSNGSVDKRIYDTKTANDNAQKELQKKFSKQDNTLRGLNKAERQKLIDKGVVTADQLKGLDNYEKNQKTQLGLSLPDNSGDKSPKATYTRLLDTYNKRKSNGELTGATAIKADNELKAARVKSDYEKGIVDAYSLGTTQLNNFLTTDKNGKATWDKLQELDKKMADAGFKPKFQDKYGNTKFPGAKSGKGKGRKGSGKLVSTGFKTAHYTGVSKAPKFALKKKATLAKSSSKLNLPKLA